MFVGIARLVLQIPGARTLKDRRQVVRSFKDRARARLSVSIAEVGELDRYQVATLGVAVVSNESARCRELLSGVRALANSLPDALLADFAIEVVTFGAGGRGVQGGIQNALEDWSDDEDTPIGADFDERDPP